MNTDYDLDELLREFSSLPSADEAPDTRPDVQQDTQPEALPVEPAPTEVGPDGYEAEPEALPEPPRHDEPQEYSHGDEGYGYEEYRDEFFHAYEEQSAGTEAPKKKNLLHEVLMAFAALVFMGISVISLFWVGLNLHPDAGTATTAAGDTRLNLTGKLDVYMNNAASDALGDLAYIRKIYTIEESALAGPVPAADGFGTTDDPAVIQKLIDDAWELLEGQEMIWSPEADFVPGEPMRYYYDETILVIQWKEYIDGRCCTCAEVKLAHGSQIRRKLSGDTYGSSIQSYASELADASNAVIAMNADYYGYRDMGITVYQRKLFRNKPSNLDSCFITAGGDLLFSPAGQLSREQETNKFIQDNDVVFSLSFGPILVDNGELQHCDAYPIGEVNEEYSRACIAQNGKLHYLLMTINHTDDARPRATVNELGKIIHSMGVEKAYNLDGGQTSEIVMMGGPVNKVDWGNERAVSDILYFATALPSQEVTS